MVLSRAFITKEQILYDSTYMRRLEEANSEKVEEKLPGAEGEGWMGS